MLPWGQHTYLLPEVVEHPVAPGFPLSLSLLSPFLLTLLCVPLHPRPHPLLHPATPTAAGRYTCCREALLVTVNQWSLTMHAVVSTYPVSVPLAPSASAAAAPVPSSAALFQLLSCLWHPLHSQYWWVGEGECRWVGEGVCQWVGEGEGVCQWVGEGRKTVRQWVGPSLEHSLGRLVRGWSEVEFCVLFPAPHCHWLL